MSCDVYWLYRACKRRNARGKQLQLRAELFAERSALPRVVSFFEAYLSLVYRLLLLFLVVFSPFFRDLSCCRYAKREATTEPDERGGDKCLRLL